MAFFRVIVTVPLASESYMAQSEQVMKLKAPLDMFRKELAKVAPAHEYHDEIVKPRAEGGARRGRKPKAPMPAPAMAEAAE